MAIHTGGGDTVPTEPSIAGSAPHNVQWQFKTYVAPHTEKVAVHAETRFLRFQAPWADGRRLSALLRRAPAKTWANLRHQRMEGAEQWRVYAMNQRSGKMEHEDWCRENTVLTTRDRCGDVAIRFKIGVKQGFFKHVGVGLLTKCCKGL